MFKIHYNSFMTCVCVHSFPRNLFCRKKHSLAFIRLQCFERNTRAATQSRRCDNNPHTSYARHNTHSRASTHTHAQTHTHMRTQSIKKLIKKKLCAPISARTECDISSYTSLRRFLLLLHTHPLTDWDATVPAWSWLQLPSCRRPSPVPQNPS